MVLAGACWTLGEKNFTMSGVSAFSYNSIPQINKSYFCGKGIRGVNKVGKIGENDL